MATQIARIGGAATVEIPEELLRQANLAVGDPVEWTWTSAGALALRTPCLADGSVATDDYGEWSRQEIQAGFAEIEAGKWVAGEKVLDWVRSLGTEHELPPPL